MEAVGLLRHYAGEIEADLLPGINIHDWHRQTLDANGVRVLSSRRLLLLAKNLPATSAFKREAQRNGDWSDDEYIQAGILNELRLLRTDFAAVNGSRMEPTLVESPRQIEVREEDTEEKARLRRHIIRQLNIGKQANGG